MEFVLSFPRPALKHKKAGLLKLDRKNIHAKDDVVRVGFGEWNHRRVSLVELGLRARKVAPQFEDNSEPDTGLGEIANGVGPR
jgi:hypothetical protein